MHLCENLHLCSGIFSNDLRMACYRVLIHALVAVVCRYNLCKLHTGNGTSLSRTVRISLLIPYTRCLDDWHAVMKREQRNVK